MSVILKTQIWRHFLKKGENKKNLSLYWKILDLNLSLLEECRFRKNYCEGIFFYKLPRKLAIFSTIWTPLRTSCPPPLQGWKSFLRGGMPPLNQARGARSPPSCLKTSIYFIFRIATMPSWTASLTSVHVRI